MNLIEITEKDAPELDIYSRLTGAELRSSKEAENGIFIAESPTVIEVALEGGCELISILTDKRLLSTGAVEALIRNTPDIPIYFASKEVLTSITGFELTRGALAAMKRPKKKSADEVTRGAKRIAVLENVCDSTNIGALFRSAAALGIDAVLITPLEEKSLGCVQKGGKSKHGNGFSHSLGKNLRHACRVGGARHRRASFSRLLHRGTCAERRFGKH